jgi:hypothetical protein
MIFGIDCAHPHPGGSSLGHSVAGVVGTMDHDFVVYGTSVKLQSCRSHPNSFILQLLQICQISISNLKFVTEPLVDSPRSSKSSYRRLTTDDHRTFETAHRERRST